MVLIFILNVIFYVNNVKWWLVVPNLLLIKFCLGYTFVSDSFLNRLQNNGKKSWKIVDVLSHTWNREDEKFGSLKIFQQCRLSSTCCPFYFTFDPIVICIEIRIVGREKILLWSKLMHSSLESIGDTHTWYQRMTPEKNCWAYPVALLDSVIGQYV